MEGFNTSPQRPESSEETPHRIEKSTSLPPEEPDTHIEELKATYATEDEKQLEEVRRKLQGGQSPEVVPENPNAIAELISFGGELETTPDNVYRKVRGDAAIEDLRQSGVVRNRLSAGLVDRSRWGERVFWSKGESGKSLSVYDDERVIVAPYAIASERAVKLEDVSAIYKKDTGGKLIDILKSLS